MSENTSQKKKLNIKYILKKVCKYKKYLWKKYENGSWEKHMKFLTLFQLTWI